MSRKNYISTAPLERILRKGGAERVSPDAAKYLAEALEDIARDMSSQAMDVAKHAKRRTIVDDDIRLVTR